MERPSGKGIGLVLHDAQRLAADVQNPPRRIPFDPSTIETSLAQRLDLASTALFPHRADSIWKNTDFTTLTGRVSDTTEALLRQLAQEPPGTERYLAVMDRKPSGRRFVGFSIMKEDDVSRLPDYESLLPSRFEDLGKDNGDIEVRPYNLHEMLSAQEELAVGEHTLWEMYRMLHEPMNYDDRAALLLTFSNLIREGRLDGMPKSEKPQGLKGWYRRLSEVWGGGQPPSASEYFALRTALTSPERVASLKEMLGFGDGMMRQIGLRILYDGIAYNEAHRMAGGVVHELLGRKDSFTGTVARNVTELKRLYYLANDPEQQGLGELQIRLEQTTDRIRAIETDPLSPPDRRGEIALQRAEADRMANLLRIAVSAYHQASQRIDVMEVSERETTARLTARALHLLTIQNSALFDAAVVVGSLSRALTTAEQTVLLAWQNATAQNIGQITSRYNKEMTAIKADLDAGAQRVSSLELELRARQ